MSGTDSPESARAGLEKFFPGLFRSAGSTSANTSGLLQRLSSLSTNPLKRTEFNQQIHLLHEAGVSEGFFDFYFLRPPSRHFHNSSCYSRSRKYSQESSVSHNGIVSIQQLTLGLEKFYVDALLCFGDLRNAYRELRGKSYSELERFFENQMYDTQSYSRRGAALPFGTIDRGDRYLISEMAFTSYERHGGEAAVTQQLKNAIKKRGRNSIKDLLSLDDESTHDQRQIQQMLLFAADEILDKHVSSEEEVERLVQPIAARYAAARKTALENTSLYLSLVNELDVYVATSMRTRKDFEYMAESCDRIFHDPSVSHLNLRYFDPTISAADVSEDKGLIECLMVKCSKALVYFAGEKDSYGKDTEVAMALSLGKPAIILCPDDAAGIQRERFFRDVHPLSRLIDFGTGVACGAIVTRDRQLVPELLSRVFSNTMEYDLVPTVEGYFRLKESLTQSVVRVQTSNRLLRESFWNYYHQVD